MSSASRWNPAVVLVAAVLLALPRAGSSSPTALSVTPSTNWYGYDGTWSAISLRVGTPQQWVDVMVSTVSSETWVVGLGGCDNNSICATDRGGLFDLRNSSTWKDKGFFELGIDSQLGDSGYADYGLDTLTFGSTKVNLTGAIIGSINTTQYWLGYFGLGIVQGNFTNVTPLSAISGLVETESVIPSHSYGFTAGATYQQKGETISLTLGGYDANRFVPHNISFELNPSQAPQAFVNSISVSSAATLNNLSTPVQLLNPDDRVSAIIDSSTPYLWLPQSVCDRFAETLGLTYNDSLNLYTFDGSALQRDVLANSQLTFTFGLADLSSSTDIVNITLPYEAFNLQLTFPAIPNTTYGAADSSKYYFPLRPATNDAQYTIGRAFLQEAYLITDYERNIFSVHQAIHIANPIGNTSIVSISRPPSSNFSGPSSRSSNKGLPTEALVGIGVGVAVVLAMLCFAAYYLWYRRQPREDTAEDEKATTAQLRTFLERFRPRRPPIVHEASGNSTYPTEVGADLTHERFELPAPLGPAELDSESGTLYGATMNGSSTEDSLNISAYERARRKLERRRNVAALQQVTQEAYPLEKNDNDISLVPHYRPGIPYIESPLVSPVGAESGGSLTISSAPSPVSPGFGPLSPIAPPPTYQRDIPHKVVYEGRLPEDVQLPLIVPRIIGPDGRTVRSDDSSGTLERITGPSGSAYADSEVRADLHGSGSSGMRTGAAESGVQDERQFPRQDTHKLETNNQTSQNLQSRRLDGEDLVHVPQPAEIRYSWEEERVAGNE